MASKPGKGRGPFKERGLQVVSLESAHFSLHSGPSCSSRYAADKSYWLEPILLAW